MEDRERLLRVLKILQASHRVMDLINSMDLTDRELLLLLRTMSFIGEECDRGLHGPALNEPVKQFILDGLEDEP